MSPAKRDTSRAREAVLAVMARHNGPISPKTLFNKVERHEPKIAEQYTMRTFRDVIYALRDAGELVMHTGASMAETRYALPDNAILSSADQGVDAPSTSAAADTSTTSVDTNPPTAATRDDVKREILAVVERHGSISGKSLYTHLAPETTKAHSYRTVRYILYEMRAAGELVGVGSHKNDTRYDLPDRVNARARETVQRHDREQSGKRERERQQQQTREMTRVELAAMRQRLQTYRKYFPAGWQSLALQYDDEQLAAIVSDCKSAREHEQQLAAAAEQLRAEARENPVEFVDVEQLQQMIAPPQPASGDEPKPEQLPSVAIELSGLAQRVAQSAALIVERALGSYSRGQELLLAAERDTVRRLREQLQSLRQMIERLQSENSALQLKVDSQPVLEDEIIRLTSTIEQLKKDVETALTTAQENERDAEQFRAMMAAISKAA